MNITNSKNYNFRQSSYNISPASPAVPPTAAVLKSNHVPGNIIPNIAGSGIYAPIRIEEKTLPSNWHNLQQPKRSTDTDLFEGYDVFDEEQTTAPKGGLYNPQTMSTHYGCTPQTQEEFWGAPDISYDDKRHVYSLDENIPTYDAKMNWREQNRPKDNLDLQEVWPEDEDVDTYGRDIDTRIISYSSRPDMIDGYNHYGGEFIEPFLDNIEKQRVILQVPGMNARLNPRHDGLFMGRTGNAGRYGAGAAVVHPEQWLPSGGRSVSDVRIERVAGPGGSMQKAPNRPDEFVPNGVRGVQPVPLERTPSFGDRAGGQQAPIRPEEFIPTGARGVQPVPLEMRSDHSVRMGSQQAPSRSDYEHGHTRTVKEIKEFTTAQRKTVGNTEYLNGMDNIDNRPHRPIDSFDQFILGRYNRNGMSKNRNAPDGTNNPDASERPSRKIMMEEDPIFERHQLVGRNGAYSPVGTNLQVRPAKNVNLSATQYAERHQRTGMKNRETLFDNHEDGVRAILRNTMRSDFELGLARFMHKNTGAKNTQSSVESIESNPKWRATDVEWDRETSFGNVSKGISMPSQLELANPAAGIREIKNDSIEHYIQNNIAGKSHHGGADEMGARYLSGKTYAVRTDIMDRLADLRGSDKKQSIGSIVGSSGQHPGHAKPKGRAGSIFSAIPEISRQDQVKKAGGLFFNQLK